LSKVTTFQICKTTLLTKTLCNGGHCLGIIDSSKQNHGNIWETDWLYMGRHRVHTPHLFVPWSTREHVSPETPFQYRRVHQEFSDIYKGAMLLFNYNPEKHILPRKHINYLLFSSYLATYCSIRDWSRDNSSLERRWEARIGMGSVGVPPFQGGCFPSSVALQELMISLGLRVTRHPSGQRRQWLQQLSIFHLLIRFNFVKFV
jgi:hypothetical protein